MGAQCTTKNDADGGKKGSSGKTCEMLLVADKSVYVGSTKELVLSTFGAPQKGILTGDPLFDVVNIPLSSYKSTEMFRVHRNVVVLEIDSTHPNKVYRYEDQYSAPQIIYEVCASDRHALDSLLGRIAQRAIEDMRVAEHKRVIKAFLGMKNVAAMQEFQKQYGFELVMSDEFLLAVKEPDFAWIKKETKDFGIGVLVQRMPYTAKSQLDSVQVLDAIDTMMRHHVPGPAEGSYMGLERTNWDVSERRVELAGQPAVEMRGMWRTFGDFMGGPFVSYTLPMPGNQELLMLVAYAYAPRQTNSMPYPKRDLLMQVESICWSLKF